jgi:hypothetical protein
VHWQERRRLKVERYFLGGSGIPRVVQAFLELPPSLGGNANMVMKSGSLFKAIIIYVSLSVQAICLSSNHFSFFVIIYLSVNSFDPACDKQTSDKFKYRENLFLPLQITL